MAVLDIEGLLNGKRLRKCSAWARWRFPYYLLLANGYARLELDCEALADKFVSFRGTAPTQEEIRAEFDEYAANHLVFIYEKGGRMWAQFDTPNTGVKEWKAATDTKSPQPPEEQYSAWLKQQHGEEWKKFHWFNPAHRTNGKRPEPEWFLTKNDLNLAKHTPNLAQTHGLGVGVGVGVGKTNPLPPLGPAALVSQENSKTEIDIDPWQAGQATADLLGLGGQQKALARDACAAVKRRKPEMRFTETPEFVCRLWREYDSLAVHAKVSLKTFLGEIGRFMDSDSWRSQPTQPLPEVDDYGGHYEQNGPQKVYVTKDGKRMPGYIPPPKAKAN